MYTNLHSFHIPVMGIGFTIDTPLKVAPLGIDSVIAIGDDKLLEKMRKMYSEKFSMEYSPITDEFHDARAMRITAYLNLMQKLTTQRWKELIRNGKKLSQEVTRYVDMLPDKSWLQQEYRKLRNQISISTASLDQLLRKFRPGRIDVNIMTKLDKENYKDGIQLPVKFNDAHAALRGFANSELSSSIVFSAGMNPRLYSYLEKFEDFYPGQDGKTKKEIILKVSDYRSAYIQGLFLAKKGLWISEFRIESGLNCGGHAFATNGYLMGPVLEEFYQQRDTMSKTIFEKYRDALLKKRINPPEDPPAQRISVQGGVGTAEEHEFLLHHYHLDSVGWGSPFLLVPEVTNVDKETRQKLMAAKEKDLYLSDISPLGVPFHSLRNNSKDQEKRRNIKKGRPGSACPKELLSLNKEFTKKPICTASRQYQHLKLKELETRNLSSEEYEKEEQRITDKSCICVGLGTSALKVNNLDTKTEGPGISICPGPNMAYFSEEVSLKKMVDHIYGRGGLTVRPDRPHMFMKELGLYMEFYEKEIKNSKHPMSSRQIKYLDEFSANLKQGIAYYEKLFFEHGEAFNINIRHVFSYLTASKSKINELDTKIIRLKLSEA